MESRFSQEDVHESERCVKCGLFITFHQAKENVEWLEKDFGRPVDEGPVCGTCALDLKDEKLEEVKKYA